MATLNDESELSELTQEDVDAMGDGLFDGWDDDLISEEADTSEDEKEDGEESAEDEDESESADQAEEEDEDEAEDDNNPEETEKPDKEDGKTSQPKSYNFKHLDENITLTADEMVPYVQKGLDYDRIRKERDAMRENYAKYEMCAEFLERYKGDFDSIEDLMDDADASYLVKNEAENGRTLTKEDALKKVKANREEKFKSKVPPKASYDKSQEENPMKAEVQSFTATFKKVFPKEEVPKWEDLPKEVQEEFEKTGQLTAPYMAWRMNQKEREIKTIKKNQSNKERSTGSRKTKGKGINLENLYDGFGDA